MTAHPAVLLLGDHLSTSVAARTPGEDLAEQLRAAGYPVVARSSRPWGVLRTADKGLAALWLRKSYRVAHLDVFGGRAFRSAELLSSLFALLNKPLILTLHGGSLPELAHNEPRRLRRVLRRAAAITAPSRYLGRELAALEPRIEVIPNPVDRSHFPFRHRPSAGPQILWLRAFHRIYDPVTAVRAFLCMADLDAEATFTLCGRDKGDGCLQEATSLAQASLHHSRFNFVPQGVQHQEVPALLSRHDVFVNSSVVDNSPVSVLEALSCGLCVVSTAVGGLSDLLEDEQNALLVPAGDSKALCQALLRLRASAELATRLSMNADRTADLHSWTDILPLWTRLYARVANAASVGAASN